VVRICCAVTGTVAAGFLGLAAVVVGVGRHLEDACLTEPPASFAPEFAVLRGPLPQGPVTFRCEAQGPGTSYVFTDAAPLLWTLVVAAGVLAVVVGLWFWAVRRPTFRKQPAPA
jgi:hypothetical protein